MLAFCGNEFTISHMFYIRSSLLFLITRFFRFNLFIGMFLLLSLIRPPIALLVAAAKSCTTADALVPAVGVCTRLMLNAFVKYVYF